MIPANINSLLLSAADTVAPTGYTISRSIRLNSADSAYFSRTPTSAGDRKIWTWAGWVKRTALGEMFLFDCRSTASANPHIGLKFSTTDQLQCDYFDGTALGFTTTALFRDLSAWYHIVLAVDNTQSVTTDRGKLYVNGEQITTFSSYTWTAQNTDTPANATQLHTIGTYNAASSFFDGYLADIHFIDGQALDPTSFGEFDATTGVWNPKAYTGSSYGTNGFRLPLSDNSAATATTLGEDSSGNGNNFTPNNLAVDPGAGYANVVGVGTNPDNMFDLDVNSYAEGEVDASLTWNGSISLGTGKFYVICAVYGLSGQGPSSVSLVVNGTTYTTNYTTLRSNTDFHNQQIGAAGTFTITSNGRRTTLTSSVANAELTSISCAATGGGFRNRIFAVVFIPSDVGDTSFADHVVVQKVGAVNIDSLVDSPTGYGTDTGVGGEVRGNYCTLNPISTVTSAALSNGNLQFTTATTGHNAIGTIGMVSGSWYWEAQASAGATQARAGVYGTAASSLYSFVADNAVYGFRFNADTGALDYTTNGSTWTSLATGLTSGPYFPYFNNNGTTSKTITVNFGARPFTYTSPAGFKALCTQNLPTPVVTKPSTVFDTTLYTGNNTDRSITGLGFSPDFVWIKGRSGATDHALYDIVRGVEKDLVSNSTAAETTQSTGLTAFNSDGFSIGTLAKLNTNSATYAAWCWDAGSSTVTNATGSISSQVRANATAGFSVVTYTGTGVNATVGHGLGVAPAFIIVKRRNAITNWPVRHTSIAAASSIQLNQTSAAASATTVWNSTAPTSAVFSIGTDSTINLNGGTYVAYCFAPVSGYSAFGSYTGNGNANGRFVFTGFRPAVVIVKMSSSTGNWTILDSKREGYNVDNDPLFPNLANAEGTTDLIDMTSNGFKVRTTDATFNTNAGTYVYAAWAESPFQYARAR